MKRAIVILLAVIMCVSFVCCGKEETSTDTSLSNQKAEISYNSNTEMMLVGTVKEVNGNSLLIVTDDKQEYVFGFSNEIKVVEKENYVYNPRAKDLLGKKVTAIAGNQVQETWPMGLTNERLIIISE